MIPPPRQPRSRVRMHRQRIGRRRIPASVRDGGRPRYVRRLLHHGSQFDHVFRCRRNRILIGYSRVGGAPGGDKEEATSLASYGAEALESLTSSNRVLVRSRADLYARCEPPVNGFFAIESSIPDYFPSTNVTGLALLT